MSEMQGVEQKQAETTKGLEETTKAVKGVESTIADGDRSVAAKLSMIGRVLSIESPTEKAARKQAQEQASAAAANAERLQQLLSQGNATEEEALAAQEEAARLAKEAEEAAEKRSMFDRFGSDEAPTPPPSGGGGGEDKETKKTGGVFGKFFKMIKGFVGILLAIAIPALAVLLNSPVFEVLKKALFDFVDFFFETVVPLLKKAYTYMKKEVFPALKKGLDDFLLILKDLYDKVIKPIYDAFINFMGKEGGGIDILLEYAKNQWENVKKIFQSMIDLFDSLMKGDFEAAFGNLGDIGKVLMDAIDEALTAILKLGLAAFGLDFDGSVGDLIGSWLTSTWESIKAALRAIIPDALEPEFLQAGNETQRTQTVASRDAIEAAEGEERDAKRKLRGGANTLKFADKSVERRAAKLAKLEKEAEEAGGFDKLEQKKFRGLDKNDIIKAREDLKKAQESAQKLKDKEAELNKQLSDAQAKKAEAEKQLAMVNKSIEGDAAANEKAGQLRKLPESESEKAAEVNKAANDNKGSTVVVQQNDQSQKSNTEQKTVIEQSKALVNQAAGGRAGRAIEGLH